mmetsp:Transcript_61047/g.145390  ORF Transcript_61047/g.145390 Transcript_61047/m.145390 type:complete len:151 (+) Transcript_61047:47-499(+)
MGDHLQRAHSVRGGKVDPVNGKKGLVVSLDIGEYDEAAATFGFGRVPGDDGPGELVQAFDEGKCWNVRWMRTGRLGSYWTGAYQLYHLRVGANDTDKSPVDLILREVRTKIEGSQPSPRGGGSPQQSRGGTAASKPSERFSLKTPPGGAE